MSRVLGTVHPGGSPGISTPVSSVNVESQQALGDSQSQVGCWSGWGGRESLGGEFQHFTDLSNCKAATRCWGPRVAREKRLAHLAPPASVPVRRNSCPGVPSDHSGTPADHNAALPSTAERGGPGPAPSHRRPPLLQSAPAATPLPPPAGAAARPRGRSEEAHV